MTVLNKILLIISQSRLSVVQPSSAFEHLYMRTSVYAIPTLIT